MGPNMWSTRVFNHLQTCSLFSVFGFIVVIVKMFKMRLSNAVNNKFVYGADKWHSVVWMVVQST